MPSDTTTSEHRYFVRIRGKKRRFIEFDFAVDTPDLSVELAMTESDFNDFCERLNVTMMDDSQIEVIEAERALWRYAYGTDEQTPAERP